MVTCSRLLGVSSLLCDESNEGAISVGRGKFFSQEFHLVHKSTPPRARGHRPFGSPTAEKISCRVGCPQLGQLGLWRTR